MKEIEDEILRIGSDKICAFIGETQLGSLVGDVPAAKGYWKKIGDLAKKYNFHIILDEVTVGWVEVENYLTIHGSISVQILFV